jgi:hypothetical protein
MGVKVAELEQMMAGVTAERIQAIREAATSWRTTATALQTVAHNMRTHKVNVTDSFGEHSAVTEAAHSSFDEAARHLNAKSSQLIDTAAALESTAAALSNARTTLDQWHARPADPAQAPAEATKQDAADETTATSHITAITGAYHDAIAQMKTVDELPGQPPASPTAGSGGGYPSVGADGGTGHTGGGGTATASSPTTTTSLSQAHTHATAPTTTHTTSSPAPTGTPPPPTGPRPSTTEPGDDGWFQGGTTSSPYPAAPSVPAASASPVGGAGVGGAGVGGAGVGGVTAGVLGGAGAAGGLGSYGSGGATPALRFASGQTIGGTPQAAAAGVLGAEDRAASGQRSVIAGGGGAGGSGGRSGGAGGGRGAGRGGAGRRGGTGAVAGRGGRPRDRDERTAEDLWDDGSEWVDDEATGPEVMR